MTQRGLLPVAPQHASIVVVLVGPTPPNVTEDFVTDLVGRPPIATGGFRGEQGAMFQWEDGFQILSRTQGPNRTRLEVKQAFPQKPNFGPLRSALVDLLPLVQDQPPQSVGINYGAVIFSAPGQTNDIFDGLYNSKKTAALFDRKQTRTEEMKFTIPMRGGIMIVTLSQGQIAGPGDMLGLLVTTNLSLETETRESLLKMMSVDRLSTVERYVSRLLRRMQGARHAA